MDINAQSIRTHLFCGNFAVLIAALLFTGGLFLCFLLEGCCCKKGRALAVCNEVYGIVYP